MKYPLYTVDAFILEKQTFTGNPAAVCILKYDDDISDETKQKIAAEINISETAFVAKGWNKDSKTDPSTFTLRWFTPTSEVELCGHATLATASVIFGLEKSEDFLNGIKFETKFKATLEAVINSDENSISLVFPLNDCKQLNRDSNPYINDVIHNVLGPLIGEEYIQDVQYSPTTKKLLIRLRDSPHSDNLIGKVSPDFSKLSKIDTKNFIRGVIVTQKSDLEGIDFLSRYFAPWVGINEDPVTGSAHTVLAPYWRRQLEENGINTNKLIGKQCSQRQGIIGCNIVGDRVYLTGKTKLFSSGELLI